MKILGKKLFWTLLFYVWLLTIYFLTSSPGSIESMPETGFGIRLDYLEHFFVYLSIPVLYFFASGAFLEKIFKDKYYIVLLGILFSILTEIQQFWIEGRAFNPLDLGLNLAGFLCGIPAGKYLIKKFQISFGVIQNK